MDPLEQQPGVVKGLDFPTGAGKVLIVDDLDLLRDLAVCFFSTAGFETMVAKDAEEALRILDESPGGFDLLFSDYNMPGMNGLELINRALKKDSKLRCVLTSGYLTDQDRKEAEAMGRTKVLGKPYQIDEALKEIIDWLGSSA